MAVQGHPIESMYATSYQSANLRPRLNCAKHELSVLFPWLRSLSPSVSPQLTIDGLLFLHGLYYTVNSALLDVRAQTEPHILYWLNLHFSLVLAFKQATIQLSACVFGMRWSWETWGWGRSSWGQGGDGSQMYGDRAGMGKILWGCGEDGTMSLFSMVHSASACAFTQALCDILQSFNISKHGR